MYTPRSLSNHIFHQTNILVNGDTNILPINYKSIFTAFYYNGGEHISNALQQYFEIPMSIITRPQFVDLNTLIKLLKVMNNEINVCLFLLSLKLCVFKEKDFQVQSLSLNTIIRIYTFSLIIFFRGLASFNLRVIGFDKITLYFRKYY